MKANLFVLPLTAVLIATSFIIPASLSDGAALEAEVWNTVNIPAEGSIGKWQLAAGSDVKKVTVASDGTLYAYANPTGSNYTLFKSNDKGVSWTPVGQVGDKIVALAAPDDGKVVYYATNTTVYRSSNGGADFSTVGSNPGGSGSHNITITGISTTILNNSRIVAVGTTDSDIGQFGGVYTLNESELSDNWSDSGLRNIDVLSVAFSPRYAIDRQLIAMGSSENGTVVAFRTVNSDWEASSGNVTINGLVPENCVAAFPYNYDNTFFLGINTGNASGGVFRINRVTSPNASTAVDLNIGAGFNASGVDVSGLAVSGAGGDYYLLVGAANSTSIYVSSDGGQNWTQSSKAPTGESDTIIALAPDFANSRMTYAGSSGAGSAFSYSVDGGITWNQLSMIDTSIDAIVDFAVSPRYGQDNTGFLLTWGGEHSLWRTQNGGANWERVYTSTQGGASTFSHLEISPQYGTNESVIVLAGTGEDEAIWKSPDKGQTFVRRSAGFTIDTLAVADNEQYFASGYNGTNNLVYRTKDGGVTFDSPAAAGSQPLSSLKLSPRFLQDGTILAGNSNGGVYLSVDSGASFQEIPGGSGSPPLTGNVFVAFDAQFAGTRTIYAASDNVSTPSARSRLYRYTLGKSQQWENLDSTVEVGGTLGQIYVLPGGTLYAANSHDNGGMERSLNPGAANAPIFESINVGLSNKADLWGLWGNGNQLWSIDSINSRLMTYVDTLTVPVVPGNPLAGSPGVDTRNVMLDWGELAGAMTYEWQVDNDGSFSSVLSSLKVETVSTLLRLPNLDPASTYYWRVRVKEPTLSPWSPTRYFYTMLGTPGTLPVLNSPKAAAEGVAMRPVFHWAAISGAEQYELLVAANISFVNPVVAKVGIMALPANAWPCDISLSYNTTYYWKIRGTNSHSYSLWSGVGTFTTSLPPAPPTPSLAGLKVVLTSPKTGVPGVGVKPLFEWGAVSGADKYELLVSTNRAFTDAAIARIGAEAVQGTIWQSDVGLRYGTIYYWKVRGVNGAGASGWSDDYSFTTVAPVKMPDPPVNITIELDYPDASAFITNKTTVAPVPIIELENPVVGAEGVSVHPVFQWQPVAGADRYELVVATDFDFLHPVVAKTGNDALSQNAWRSELSLASDTTYYWKIRAINSANLSVWSSVSVFTTLRPAPQNEVKLAFEIPLPVVELDAPVRGDARVSTLPLFTWKGVAGADKYELLVSPDIAFTQPVIMRLGDYALSDTAWGTPVALNYDTSYWWKVRAISVNRSGDWSVPGVFITEDRPLPALAVERPVLPSWVIYIGATLIAIVMTLGLSVVTLFTRIKRG